MLASFIRSTWYSAPLPAACMQKQQSLSSGLGLLVGLGSVSASLQVELEVPPSQRPLMHHGEGE